MSIHIAVNERLFVGAVGAVPVWQTGYPGAKTKSLNPVCLYYHVNRAVINPFFNLITSIDHCSKGE